MFIDWDPHQALSSATFTMYTHGIGTLSYTVSSPLVHVRIQATVKQQSSNTDTKVTFSHSSCEQNPIKTSQN